jgi:hypothetical protein
MSRRILSWSLLFVVVIAVLVMMWNSKNLNAGIQENNFLYTSGRAAAVVHRPHASMASRIAVKVSNMVRKSPKKVATN